MEGWRGGGVEEWRGGGVDERVKVLKEEVGEGGGGEGGNTSDVCFVVQCEGDLAEAIPALEAAISALNTLKVSHHW